MASTLGFTVMASVTASTKRHGAVGSTTGLRAAAATNIASLKCTPLDPVDAELKQRLGLDTPHQLLQTYVDGGLDIKVGDILVVSSVEYPIKRCGKWDWRLTGSNFVALVVEDLD
jgi:hypothetical protein